MKKLRINEINRKDLQGSIDISIQENGDLNMGLYDRGETVEKIFGDDEYEYDLTVKKENAEMVLLHLMKEKFSSTTEFKKWLQKNKIPFTEESW